MKRRKILVALVVVVCLLAGCDQLLLNNESSSVKGESFESAVNDGSSEINDDESSNGSEDCIDYNDAEAFETALNDGENVNRKVVQFFVVEYIPDSFWGVNCHSGEHLNFIFENEINVADGDTVVVRIIEEPSKSFGSWKVPCEFIRVSKPAKQEESGTEAVSEETSELDNSAVEEKPSEIVLTMGSSDFAGMDYLAAEQKFREMGFTEFKYKTVGTNNQSEKDLICYIEITEFLFGDSNFSKGDKYDIDSTITFYYYEYEAPKPLFYSTNDYETAKKGNTGVFSYKNKSGAYDIYWIIDFDEGYVYFFTEGNGDNTCDKIQIVSGDLNDKITITWHDGGDEWSWHLHFKYQNHPETLIVDDHAGFATDFTTTDLTKALSLRAAKKIVER